MSTYGADLGETSSGYGAGSAGSGSGGGGREFNDANRYATSLYLDVTSDANKWKAGGTTALAGDGAPSKLNQILTASKGLAVDRALPNFDVAVIGVQPRKEHFLKDVSFGPMSSYVEYVIKVTRLRDGATSVVCHRYSALRAFHDELTELGLTKMINAPEFPRKKVVSEESFLLERADVESEFIKRRREELHHFLRRLFNQAPSLWDHEFVQNFFNLQSLDVGKTYAERSRAMTDGGSDFTLAHYNPSDPAQWNPYTMAMQASEVTRARNHPNQQLPSTAGSAAAPPGRPGSLPAGGGFGGGFGGSGADPIKVRSLCELGFSEATAATALTAAGGDPDLAAEYCISGIPPSAAAAAAAQAAASQPRLPPPEPPKKTGWFGLGGSRKDSAAPAPSSAGLPPAPGAGHPRRYSAPNAGSGTGYDGGGGGYHGTGSFGGGGSVYVGGYSSSSSTTVGSGAAVGSYGGSQSYGASGGGGGGYGGRATAAEDTAAHPWSMGAAAAGGGGGHKPGSGGPGTVDV